MATIGSHYARAALNGAVRQGLPEKQLLAQTSINPELLDDPKGRIDSLQMSSLIRAIWRQSGDEFMGFTPHPCRNGVFALMTGYASQASTLRGLLNRGLHFYNLFTADIEMTLQIVDTQAYLSFKFSSQAAGYNAETYDPEHFFSEFWMIIWHRFASWYIGEAVHLQAAHFHYDKPDYLHELQLGFPCPLQFNQAQTRLIFDRSYLEKPLIRSAEELTTFLHNSPADLMTMPGEDKSLEAQIKARLLATDTLAIPHLQAMAREFSITAQTLNNRLKKEATSYQRIKDEIRRDIAIDKLVNECLSIETIATLLGFKEARSFTRAFKQWTGVSPRGYRLRR